MTSTLIRTCFGWLKQPKSPLTFYRTSTELHSSYPRCGTSGIILKYKITLIYHELASDGTDSSLSYILEADINRLKPQEIYLKQPGDYRVRTSLIKVIEKLGVPLTIAEDESFAAKSSSQIMQVTERFQA